MEEHLARLRENLIPQAERCGRVMREALATLEVLRGDHQMSTAISVEAER